MAQALRGKGSMLSATDFAALVLLAICAYLYNGQHAQLVCHLASVLPPALFSYLRICDRKTTPEGMRSLLFFWFLQGILLCLDAMAGDDTKGFYLAKFLLLSGAFWKAVKDNNYGYAEKSVVLVSRGVVSTCAESELQSADIFDDDWPTASTQGARSMLARRDLDDESTDEASTAIGPSTLTAFSDAFSEARTVTEFDALSTRTCSSFRPPAAPSKTKDQLGRALVYKNRTLPGTAPHYSASRGRALADKSPWPCVGLRAASPSRSIKNLPSDFAASSSGFPTNEEFAAGDPGAMSVAIGRDDLCTDPSDTIVIPGQHATVLLKVQNTTDKAAMFALKCNAVERVKATPNAGVIPAGVTRTIRICLNDNAQWAALMGESRDKLAIDYHLCEATVTRFDKPTFFAEDAAKFRVRLGVLYRFED